MSDQTIVVDRQKVQSFFYRYFLNMQKCGKHVYVDHESWTADWGELTNEAKQFEDIFNLKSDPHVDIICCRLWFEALSEKTGVPLPTHLLPKTWRN